jgi:hypothetical protein
MFDSYLNRVIPQGKDLDSKEIANETETARAENTRREKKKKGPTKEENRPLFLSLEQKSEIATRELEELRDGIYFFLETEIQHNKEQWAKIMDNCKVCNNELMFYRQNWKKLK